MVVKVGNLDVSLELLDKIASGKDGDIYLFRDKVIKINKSGYMTEEKIRDLQVASESERLIIPIDIVNPTPRKLLRVENPCFGYTTRYLEEDKFGLLYLSTMDYLEQIEWIKRDINEYFSKNKIAITDTNPHNLLISKGVIHLIDFDRNVTKSSMYSLQEPIIRSGQSDPYRFYNSKRVDYLTYRGLLLSIAEYADKEKIKSRKIGPYILEKEGHPDKFRDFIDELIKYNYIYDYAKEKVKMLTK